MEMRRIRAGFVCFGEVNTPMEVIVRKRDEAVAALANDGLALVDGGIVTDDPAYRDADAAVARLRGEPLDLLIVCVAGWIPTHAVVRVTDVFRAVPMVLWGLRGWRENGKLVTTADQAGTTALRPAFEALGYNFTYIYSIIDRPLPAARVMACARAARAAALLRETRVGTMGYRDMLLYGTQFEGNSLRRVLGVEVEPFEMLEMTQRADRIAEADVAALVARIRREWVFDAECPDDTLATGARYALAVAEKIRERGWSAVTLIDVDGMKKLLGFPPAMIFMLLGELCGVETIPENDVPGAVTQCMIRLLTGQTAAYLEFYEFFEDSVLIGVPDFIPRAVTEGDVHVLPTAFGLLSKSLLNVSKVRTGRVTLSRLVYREGRYFLHLTAGEAFPPEPWEECGWAPPAPQLPSLRVKLDVPVSHFAERVSSQHTIVCYGDETESIERLCGILGIEVIR